MAIYTCIGPYMIPKTVLFWREPLNDLMGLGGLFLSEHRQPIIMIVFVAFWPRALEWESDQWSVMNAGMRTGSKKIHSKVFGRGSARAHDLVPMLHRRGSGSLDTYFINFQVQKWKKHPKKKLGRAYALCPAMGDRHKNPPSPQARAATASSIMRACIPPSP